MHGSVIQYICLPNLVYYFKPNNQIAKLVNWVHTLIILFIHHIQLLFLHVNLSMFSIQYHTVNDIANVKHNRYLKYFMRCVIVDKSVNIWFTCFVSSLIVFFVMFQSRIFCQLLPSSVIRRSYMANAKHYKQCSQWQ